MGGFIKGIVTGVASFVLGFAVLSVVMPVEDPPAEDGAVRGDDVAIVAQPETLTTLPDPVQAAPVQPEPVQPEPVQPEPVQPEPVQAEPVQPVSVQPDASASQEQPAPVVLSDTAAPAPVDHPADPPAAQALPAPVQDEAADIPRPLDPVATLGAEGGQDMTTPPQPLAGLHDERAAPTTTQADAIVPIPVADAPANDTLHLDVGTGEPDAAQQASEPVIDTGPSAAQAPAGTAADTASDTASDTAADTAGGDPAPGPQADVPTVETGAAGSPGPDADSTPITDPVPAQTQADTPVPSATPSAPAPEPASTPVAGPESDAEPPLPAEPEPAAPAAGDRTGPVPPQPTPAQDAPVDPVPAQVVPPSEPTLPIGPAQPGAAPSPRAPHSPRGPRVLSLPGAGSGAGVRRGGAAISAAEPRVIEGVTVGRLPSIGGSPATSAEAPAVDPSVIALSDADADPSQPAWRRNGVAVPLPEGARAMGVVLLDSAQAEADLLALPFAVTVALDPYDPDAPRRAAGYRNAGHEIALLAAGLPDGATAADIAVTLESWRHEFPDTAELMDVPVNGVGANRALARTLAEMAAPQGYGLIVQRDGVDALFQAARANSMAAAPVYRVLDDAGQGPMTLRRLLDRAAFEAQRRAGILIVGSAANPETLAALSSYVQGAGREGVVLTPASAVLDTP